MKKYINIMINIGIVFAILSQIPQVNNIFRLLNSVIWILTIIIILFCNRKKLKITKFENKYLVSMILLIIYILIMGAFGFSHIKSSLTRVLVLPIIIYVIGVNIGEDLNIKQVFRTYIIMSLLLCIWINITYFPSISIWSKSMLYLYGAKNSAGQILSVAIFLLVNAFLENNKKMLLVIAIYLFFVICLLQCKTAILSILIAIFTYYLLNSNVKRRIYFAILIVLLGVFIFNYKPLYNFMEHVFFIDKYENGNINDFSSNRLELYKITLKSILENPFIGLGDWYIDDVYLCLIANYGIFMGGLFIIIIINRFKLNLKNSYSNFKLLLFFLTIYYFFTSLFEGYPPFGPGTCSFMFWLLCGINDSIYNKRKYREVKKFDKQ